MKRLIKCLLWGLILVIMFSYPAFAAHLSVKLKADDGSVINPLTGENADKPYSPEKTCGTCHNYNTISKGYHFQPGWDIISDDFNLKKNMGLSESPAEKDGKVEIDCMICHLPDYDFNKHSKLLVEGNSDWAPAVAAGIANVAGSIGEEKPQINYDSGKFNSKGKLNLDFGASTSQNCLNCHGATDMVKRGFSWNDEKNPDVHAMAGISCTECHVLVDNEETPALQHQIGKGTPNEGSITAEYSNTVISCRECHENGQIDAPIPSHEKIKESHLDFISCEACHIPFKNRAAGGVVDVTTGSLVTLPNVQGTKGLKAEAKWQPELIRREDGKIYPVNTIHAVWWGNKNSDDKIVPLFLKEIKPAFEKVKSKVSDDNKDGKPEVNTQEEITAMLGALQDSLQGNKRLDRIHPVFVKGGKVYEFDSAGSLISEEHPLAEAEGFSVSHNVAPAEEALGANGCGDCHDSESRFVIGKITQDPFGPGGKPVFTSQGDVLGITPSVMGLHGTYQGNFNWLLIFAVLGVFVFCLAHYLIIGPNEKHLGKLPRDTVRYTGLERWTHNIRMISCILLMVTGSGFALYSMGVLKIFGGYSSARTIHIILGALFIITSIVATVIWMKKCVFKAYDIEWLKVMGGYLTKKECHPAAGCFNAGQKLFYWISTFLSLIIIVTGIMLINRDSISGNVLLATVFIHGASALTLIAAVVGHAYLGSFANPGTWKVLLDGKVAGEWCKVHHPYWKPEEKEEAK